MTNLDAFKGSEVLVVGDVMLDRYWWGDVNRISPEAPVPVVRMRSTSLAAGGAANVAANIAGLGGIPYLIGVVGDDAEGNLLPDILLTAGVSGDHLVRLAGRPTTVKTRLVAHGQHVARVDQESDDELSADHVETVNMAISEIIEKCRVVVVSDYAKGLLTDAVLSHVISTARDLGRPVLVDPKGKNYQKYAGATLLTPNKREALDACGLDDGPEELVDAAGKDLMERLSLDSILITQGEKGMTLFETGKSPFHLHARARKVYDVTGAGDTVIATIAVALAGGMSLPDAASIANIAAGLVVETVGTSSIKLSELAIEFEESIRNRSIKVGI